MRLLRAEMRCERPGHCLGGGTALGPATALEAGHCLGAGHCLCLRGSHQPPPKSADPTTAFGHVGTNLTGVSNTEEAFALLSHPLDVFPLQLEP